MGGAVYRNTTARDHSSCGVFGSYIYIIQVRLHGDLKSPGLGDIHCAVVVCIVIIVDGYAVGFAFPVLHITEGIGSACGTLGAAIKGYISFYWRTAIFFIEIKSDIIGQYI